MRRKRRNLTVQEAREILANVPIIEFDEPSNVNAKFKKGQTFAMMIGSCNAVENARKSRTAYIGWITTKNLLKDFGEFEERDEG